MIQKKLAVLVNARAGKGQVRNQILAARSNLWGRQLEICIPQDYLELQAFCLKLNSRKTEALVVCGGDGTLNHVVRALQKRKSPIPLYAFPSGTANDFAREMKTKADWEQVQSVVDKQELDWIDIVEINKVPFITVAGIGIGSTLTEEFNQKRTQSGLYRILSRYLQSELYSLLAAQAILLRKTPTYRISVQSAGFNEVLRTPAMFFCNQTQLGGSLTVAPSISNNDQRFNVMIVNSKNKMSLLSSMLKLKRGFLPSHFYVFSAKEVTLRNLDGRVMQAFGDGETLVEGEKLQIQISEQKLPVFRGYSIKTKSSTSEAKTA